MAAVEQGRQLEQLYEAHAPALRRRCLRLTRDPHAAEDLMQEVFVRFLARFPEPPAEMHVAAYLYATARNILWKQLRDQHEVADGAVELAAGADDDIEIDPERSALLGEQQRLVRRCAAVLTGRQRRALTLREVEGRSYAEIGDELGIGSDAVGQVISRARVRLRVAVRRAQVDLDRLAPACRAMLGPLSDRVDGNALELSTEVEAHLAQCASCRRTLAALQTAGSRLRGALPFAPLAGLVARIGEAVRLAGGASADVARAGGLVVAAALAVGGGGMVAAYELGAPAQAARPRAEVQVVLSAQAGAPAPISAIVAGGTPVAALGAAPGAVRGRDATGRARSKRPGRHPATPASPSRTPGAVPVVASSITAATPASTPSEPPATRSPGTTPRSPVDGGTGAPAAVPPIDPATEVTRAVDRTVAPVVRKVVSNVVSPVVTGVVEPAAAPVEAVVGSVLPPPADPSSGAATPPAVSVPAVSTPAITTPVVTLPPITLPPIQLGGQRG